MKTKLFDVRKVVSLVSLLTPLILFGTPTTWWVATNGVDEEGRGGEDEPFATLPYALGKAVDGDTIKVKAGTYDVPAGETLDTFYAVVTQAVTVESVGGEAILDGGNRRCLPLQINNAKAVVRGFRFQKVASWNTWNKYLGGVVDIQDGTLADSTVCDSTTKCYGGVLMRAGVLTNCVVRNVRCGDNSSSYGGGVELYSGNPLVVDCVFDGCKAHSGSAVYIRDKATGGIVRNCRMINSKSITSKAGGSGAVWMEAGLVENCIIATNTITVTADAASLGAGGVNIKGGTLRNCLVARNTTVNGYDTRLAGGVVQSGGSVESCTVVYNRNGTQTFSGQGYVLQSGSMLNTVVAFNGSFDAYTNPLNMRYENGSVTYSSVYPAIEGEGNLSADPLFDADAADGVPLAGSGLLDKGSDALDWMADALDVYGNPRLHEDATRVDIGCVELARSGIEFGCVFSQDATIGALPLSVNFEGAVFGAPGEISSVVWDFGDGSTDETGSLTPRHTYAAYGRFDVKLTVRSEDKSCSNVVASAVTVGATTTYVSADGGNVWPYASEADSATNLVDAIDALVYPTPTSVGTVNVLPGRYVVPSGKATGKYYDTPWIVLSNAVHIVGVEGPEKTLFDGRGVEYTYAFVLDHVLASISGVCISNCVSQISWQQYAGGTLRIEKGSVENCVVRDCVGYYNGAVSLVAGSITDTRIINCHSDLSGNGYGGGLLIKGAGVVSNCVVEGCASPSGAVYLNNAAAKFVRSTVRGCTSTASAAVYVDKGATVDSCSVVGNSGAVLGGGLYLVNGPVRNSLIADNVQTGSSSASGGGVYLKNGTVDSCTIAGNCDASGTAHGIYQAAGSVVNCVVSRNAASGKAFGDGKNHVVAGGSVTYTCTYPSTISGEGNLWVDPRFLNPNGGNWRIGMASPIARLGRVEEWMTDAKDLRGNARLYKGAVTPGCYEPSAQGLVIFLH